MPHPRILKALGMSPEQWGALPPETVSNDRNELKKKAYSIIAKEEADSGESLHAKIERLEARVKKLEGKGG